MELLRAAGPDAHSELGNALRMQGNLRYSTGEGDAVAATAESVQLLEKLGPRHAGEYLISVLAHADVLAALERNDEALAAANRGLAHPFAQAADYATVRSELQGVRARALTGLQRYAEAEPALDQVIAVVGASFGPAHSNTRYWRYLRVQLLDAMGRLDDARAEIQTLLTQAATGHEHPMAQMARLITAASLDEQRRAANTAEATAEAQAVACGANGNEVFCAKVCLLGAEVAIRERRIEAAQAALDECAKDAALARTELLARRLKVLRARLARESGQLDAAREWLDQAQAGAVASADETAMLDVERGYLARAAGDREAAVAALARGRAHIAKSLTTLTPQVREIDAALRAAQPGQ